MSMSVFFAYECPVVPTPFVKGLFSTDFPWPLCKILVGHICVSLFLDPILFH